VNLEHLNIVIAGGSGQIGTILARALFARGHAVTVLSRRPSNPRPWRVVAWDGRTVDTWAGELEGADAVINLCGRSVDCRYNEANRRAILESRTFSTQALGAAVGNARRPPGVWLQASTATIYAHSFDQPNDELTGQLGGNEPNAPDTWRFSIEIAKAWEAEALASVPPHTRLVLMRSAMTMSADPGGVFDILLRLVRFELGGHAGDGRQYISWIHEADFVQAVLWLIQHPEISGPVNLAAPAPLPNREFMAVLRAAWGTRLGLPSPAWLLEVGAALIRTETELILKSRRVVPGILAEYGFRFCFRRGPAPRKTFASAGEKLESLLVLSLHPDLHYSPVTMSIERDFDSLFAIFALSSSAALA